MTIPTKSQTQFVGDMTASWGAALQISPVLPVGDFLLALFEATSTQLTFLQAQALLVLALARASTSTGPDLDTWMADFSFTRLPATFATGPVTLSSLQIVSSPVFVPAATLVGGVYSGGTLVQTTGGAQVYQVIPDTTQSTYSSQSNSYVLSAGATSMTVTVQAVTAGSAYNVAIGAINQLASQQGGISLVNNLVPFSNGIDAESDASFRARFVLYLQTLAKATKAAILAAALGVQQGLQITAVENIAPNGTTQLGAFTVFVDNGTGAPPASLIASVFAAVDATRAFGIEGYVAPATIVNATIVVPIRPSAGFALGPLQPLVQNAVATQTNQLATGVTLTISSIIEAALGVTGVGSVQASSVTINGASVDFVPSAISEIRTNSSLITVGSY